MLWVELEGSHGAHCAGLSADSVMRLARKLIAAGYPDQPFECYREDKVSLTFKSLAWAARHTIHEEPTLTVAVYKKFSKSIVKNSEHGTTRGTYSPITGTPLQQETLPEA